jgi:inhibitor of cysteine peptidase
MACLGLFLSLNCATSFAQKSSQPKITLTKADSGKTITVHVGDKIAITLPENPSTGYTWAIDQTNSNILKSLSSTYTQNPAHKPSAGVPGNRTFLFQVQQPGTVHLRLKQWRSREGNKSITDRFDVTINVTHAR